MTNTADLLEQVPDLGEDLKDPEDCFTEGPALGGPWPQPQPCQEGQEDQQLLGPGATLHPILARLPPLPSPPLPSIHHGCTKDWGPLHLQGGSMAVHSLSGWGWG